MWEISLWGLALSFYIRSVICAKSQDTYVLSFGMALVFIMITYRWQFDRNFCQLIMKDNDRYICLHMFPIISNIVFVTGIYWRVVSRMVSFAIFVSSTLTSLPNRNESPCIFPYSSKALSHYTWPKRMSGRRRCPHSRQKVCPFCKEHMECEMLDVKSNRNRFWQ